MNLEVVRLVLQDRCLQALLGAALLLATENGATVKEIAKQLGIPKTKIRKYSEAARTSRARDPKAFLVYSAIASGGCDHTQLWGPGLRICLYCLRANNPDHPGLYRRPGTDPKPEPSKVYKPSKYKGGIGK